MPKLQRTVWVLTSPVIALFGAGCGDMPTEPRPAAGRPMAVVIADPTLVVDDDQMECPAATYTSIQPAVNDAMTGDIITVCPGTYTENVVVFNKRLTLRGAQWGMDARGRVASEAIVTPLVPTTATLTLQSGSAGSIIDGFTFRGGSFLAGQGAIASTSGPIDDLQILNNRIRDMIAGSGVWLNDNGINITVNQNEIDGSIKLGNAALFHLDTDNFDGLLFTNNRVVNGVTGTGFFVDGNRNVDNSTVGSRMPEFTGNFIDNNGAGVNLGRMAWGDGPITGNTFSNNVFDGLQGGPKNSMITLNTFDANGRHGLALTGFSPIVSTDPNRGAQDNTVTQNCFTGNGVPLAGAGISFSATQFPGTISTNEAHQNNISSNAIGAQYLGPETIDATFNWWGSPTGPFHAPDNTAGTGNPVVDDGDGITFKPFLTSPAVGTPCSPPPLPPSGKVTGGGQIDVTDGKGSFGFNAKLEDEDGSASGHLNYLNHATGAHLDCEVKFVTELTTTTAKFQGTCTPKGTATATSFMAEVEDHGHPGKNVDKFKIMYGSNTDGSTVTTIRSGNIQIHK